MSTPQGRPGPAAGQGAGRQPAQQVSAPAAAQQVGGQQAQQVAGQQQPSPSAAQTGAPAQGPTTATSSAVAPRKGAAAARSTPSRLRLARGLATAAALLTGIAATGTFDTSGVNATPNVVAAQWEASERAGAEVAATRLEVARAVLDSAAQVPQQDRASDPTGFVEPVSSAADWLARSGSDSSGGLVEVALSARAAVEAADADAAVTAYGEVVDLTDDTLTGTRGLAAAHAEDLRTGSRSTLTAVVGGVSTLLLAGLLVWLALLTRRIINVPLLIATAITAGLTYVSLNPSALPLDIDQRVDRAGQASQALQDVRLARAAQHAQVLGLGDSRDAVVQATASTRALGDRGATDAWRAVFEGQDELDASASPDEGLAALAATEEHFTRADDTLTELVDTRLGGSVGEVGRPALITSGLALVLGLVAAGFAWSGLTQRLRDYR